jgi:signal transduction histidine kinase
LLRIAQIESGSRRANFQYLALAELFAELVEAYEPVAEERQQVLSCSIDCTLRVDGDRELLVQLFSNLIENALQHAPERGAVTIEALRDRDGVQVVVADDGPGIPPEDRQRVLQRFVRLETSRHRPGTGLGLSLVAAIATLHGVQLRLEDNRPGLRCVLHFPAAVS